MRLCASVILTMCRSACSMWEVRRQPSHFRGPKTAFSHGKIEFSQNQAIDVAIAQISDSPAESDILLGVGNSRSGALSQYIKVHLSDQRAFRYGPCSG